MKKKELKRLAQKIAQCEYIIQTSSDDKAIRRAQDNIFMLTGQVDSLEDITIIDEMI
jgi:hypothetical protein